jgi:hypothetical protein
MNFFIPIKFLTSKISNNMFLNNIYINTTTYKYIDNS